MKVDSELRKRIQVDEAWITTMRVDAIVNTPHASLLTGEGVHGPIHRVAGPQLLEACRVIGGCPPGHAEITAGYHLSARWVIHAVCPYLHGNELPNPHHERLLAHVIGRALTCALNLASGPLPFRQLPRPYQASHNDKPIVSRLTRRCAFCVLMRSPRRWFLSLAARHGTLSIGLMIILKNPNSSLLPGFRTW